MNKAGVVEKVAELSGVPRETCESVLDALEKVLQKELGAADGLGGALGKITGLLNYLQSRKSE